MITRSKKPLKKPMIIMLGVMAIFFSLIFGWKVFMAVMTKKYLAKMMSPTVTVSTMKAEESIWQPILKAVGSLRADVGVDVTTELAGMVDKIYFNSGMAVKKGEVLVQLNAGPEIGRLHSLEAQVELAKITYRRDKAQYNAHAISKQNVDVDEWNLKNLQAQVEEQRATLEKKTIRAPFSGMLGIREVNLGQYLNVGDTIATLQALDPIKVDFYVPQQDLAQLEVGQAVSVQTDTFPNQVFKGQITTIQPKINNATRNVTIEAKLPNAQSLLKPGMFVRVEVSTGSKQKYITLPQSAISFNPYGDLVYLVEQTQEKNESQQPRLIAKQVFVTVGETRGDQIVVLKGVKVGDTVVTSGQLKLKNSSLVKINNQIQPSNSADPKIQKR